MFFSVPLNRGLFVGVGGQSRGVGGGHWGAEAQARGFPWEETCGKKAPFLQDSRCPSLPLMFSPAGQTPAAPSSCPCH